MTVSEAIAASGITPAADYKGVEMTDDYVLAIQTAETQANVGSWIVCADYVKGYPAALNPTTNDATYVRTGTASTKSGQQRSFSIEGDRCVGDAFQDFCLSHDIKYGTGQDVVVPYVWFSLRTGKGEKGTAAIIVNEDAGGNAGSNAGFKIDLKASAKPEAYTYSAA